MEARPISWRKRIGIAAAVALLVLTCALAFCIDSTDARTANAFANAVADWQRNPDFRRLTFEYVDLGCRAMQCRVWGFPAAEMIVVFRKLPGLPKSVAMNVGSQLHYDDFSRGPVEAYIRLSSEQGVAGGVEVIEKIGDSPTDEQIRQMLSGFKLPYATCTDAGAVASVRSVMADVQPDRPFAIRGLIGTQMQAGIEALARSRATSDIDALSISQQMDLLGRYDRELQDSDHQLWRTKQVNDLLAGIWAQAYGQYYETGIHAVMRIRLIARIMLIGEVIAIVMIVVGRRRRTSRASV